MPPVSLGSSVSLVRCLLLFHMVLVCGRLLLLLDSPRLVLRSLFDLDGVSDGSESLGSWRKTESARPVEDRAVAVDLKTRLCAVAIVALPALIDGGGVHSFTLRGVPYTYSTL